MAGEFSRFYLAVDPGADVATVFRTLHGHVFAAENGREYRAAVDMALNQAVPWADTPEADPPAKTNRLAGTLEADEEFLQFKQRLEADPEEPPSAEALLAQHNAASRGSSVKKSALVAFLENRTLHIKARPKKQKQKMKKEPREPYPSQGLSKAEKLILKEARKPRKKEKWEQKQEAREQTRNGRAERGSIPFKAALKKQGREAQAHSGALAQAGPGPGTRPPIAKPSVARKGDGGAERQPAAGPAGARGGGWGGREKKPKGPLIPTAIIARKVSSALPGAE